jgi:hypothetical protein
MTMVTKKAVVKKAPAEKGKTKKAAPKAPKKEVAPEPEPELIEEDCCCSDCDSEPIEKNPARSYVLRDIWYESLGQVIDEEAMPEENKREMLFLTLSNALLDMIMDIVPADIADIVAENIDDFLTVTAVNREYDVDLLLKFKEDFVNEKGDTFEDEDELNEALNEFEESWWNAPRDDLKGKSPNEALEETAKNYDL